MFCKFCGASLPDDAAFCPACGVKVTGEAKPEAPKLHTMRCESCGSTSLRKLPTGGYRCEHCGTRFFTEEEKPGKDNGSVDAQVAILLSEAAAFAEKNDYQNEIQALTKAVELSPENNTALLRLGRAYWQLGSLEKAMEYYRIAEELYPNDPAVYSNIGSNFFKLGHYAEAYAQYEKAVAIINSDPNSASAGDTAVMYANYAYSLGKLGDKKNAVKYLSIAKEKGYSKESINRICEDLHIFRFLI